MDGSRFDTWTRRTFGLAMGGAAATALGLALPERSDAKKKRKRCQKLRQKCQPGSKNKTCCKNRNLVCDEVPRLAGKHCCRQLDGKCDVDQDCCAGFTCNETTGKCWFVL